MKRPIIIQFAAVLFIAALSSFSSVIAGERSVNNIFTDELRLSGDIVSVDTSDIALMTNGLNFNMFLKENINYPALAMEKEIEGSVRVLCSIGTDGLVKDVKVLSAVDEMLANEVIKAAKQLSFIPATQNGYAVPYSIIIPVKFNLR